MCRCSIDPIDVQGMPGIAWEVADMLALPFQPGAFDAVIEKGTMDVLYVDNDSPWEPRPEVCARVKQMLDETHRCVSLPEPKNAHFYTTVPLLQLQVISLHRVVMDSICLA